MVVFSALVGNKRKSTVKKISSSQIDKIYEYGIKTGARGGKLLGAGGGGFLLFAVDPINRKRFSEDILVKGSEVVQFTLKSMVCKVGASEQIQRQKVNGRDEVRII